MPVPRSEFEGWVGRRIAVIESDVGWVKDTMKTQNTNTWLLAGVLVTVALDLVLRVI